MKRAGTPRAASRRLGRLPHRSCCTTRNVVLHVTLIWGAGWLYCIAGWVTRGAGCWGCNRWGAARRTPGLATQTGLCPELGESHGLAPVQRQDRVGARVPPRRIPDVVLTSPGHEGIISAGTRPGTPCVWRCGVSAVREQGSRKVWWCAYCAWCVSKVVMCGACMWVCAYVQAWGADAGVRRGSGQEEQGPAEEHASAAAERADPPAAKTAGLRASRAPLLDIHL